MIINDFYLEFLRNTIKVKISIYYKDHICVAQFPIIFLFISYNLKIFILSNNISQLYTKFKFF